MRLEGGDNPRPDQGHSQTYNDFKEDLERLTERMGKHIARHTKTNYGDATFEGMAFGGCCVPISPNVEGQPIPEALKGLDDEGWDA